MEGLSSPAVKRVPSYVAPDLAAAVRRQLALSLRLVSCSYTQVSFKLALSLRLVQILFFHSGKFKVILLSHSG